MEIEDSADMKYVKVDFYVVNEKKWMLAKPEMTFEDLINSFQNLITAINNWENKYSDNPIML